MALFNNAVTWPRKNRVLLPGVSVLARQVSEARTAAERRLYEAVARATYPTCRAVRCRGGGPARIPGTGKRRGRHGPHEGPAAGPPHPLVKPAGKYAVSGPCGDLLPVDRFTLTRSRRA